MDSSNITLDRLIIKPVPDSSYIVLVLVNTPKGKFERKSIPTEEFIKSSTIDIFDFFFKFF